MTMWCAECKANYEQAEHLRKQNDRLHGKLNGLTATIKDLLEERDEFGRLRVLGEVRKRLEKAIGGAE